MKIGILAFLSEESISPAEVARKCEALGFESLFLPEHAIIPVKHRVPTWPATAPFLSRTHTSPIRFWASRWRLRLPRSLGSASASVLVPEHHPLALAKTVATLDHFSGGRLLFGIGAGWLADESEIMGVDFKRPSAVSRSPSSFFSSPSCSQATRIGRSRSTQRLARIAWS